MLLVASYVFYGWWDWRFLSLLFISTITDFIIAKSMSKCGENRKGTKTALLITSLAINLGILGFFKYFNFFAQSFERVVAPLGLHPDFVTLNILLPVGISFYTFQTMAYTIDVYRGNDNPCKNFWDFALYVAFFPSLVAGPIDRSTNLIPQIQKSRSITWAMIYSACQLILMGYFKKVFIADGVAPIVNECFTTPDKFGGITLLLGAYLFIIQIYGDFSGYTDIARGVARMFGIELMLNFRQPFFSKTTTEFWQRWHISLSSWFREYLYYPMMYWMMDRSRYRMPCLFISLMITMLICGLWHGAAAKFIIFGGLQGLFLCIDALLLQSRWWKKHISNFFTVLRLETIVGIIITVTLFSLSSVFFRASSCTAATHYLMHIFHGGHAGFAAVWLYVWFYGLCVLILDYLCAVQGSEVPFTDKIWAPIRGFGYACMLFLLVFIGENDVQPFIYFQF
jgi:D-alanyl-lipoteichoic acid acyltransferase DltB (MBOAT superfamily)